MAYESLEVGLGALSDTGVSGGTKLNNNIAKLQSLQTGVGLAEGTTNIGNTTQSSDALASGDTLVTRVQKLKGLIDAAASGGGGDLALTDLGVDFDLSLVTGDVRGTTAVNAANTAISSQYPLSADGIWNIEVKRSAAVAGSGFSSGGELLDFVAVRQATSPVSARVFFATKAGGTMSPWVDLAGLPPNTLTNDVRQKTHILAPTNGDPLELVNGGFYRLPTTTVAATAGLPYSPPTDIPMDWDVRVSRVALTGRIEVRALYSDGGAPPATHTWEAEVFLTSEGASRWSEPAWKYVHGAALDHDPVAGAPKLTAAKYELWLKIGQSNAVGVDQFKEDGVNQEPFDPYGADAPHPRVMEVSRAAATAPMVRAPANELHMSRFPCADRDASNNLVTFSQYFGAARCDAHPEIEKLAIVNSAVGATAMSVWAPGGGPTSLFVLARDRCNLFLQRHPEYAFAGIIWHQGESDAIAGRTTAQYEGDLAAMVAAFRAQIRGAANSAFICGTMSIAYREITSGATTPAMKDEIHQAHLRTRKYISNSALVNMDDIRVIANDPGFSASNDVIHFARQHQREMGRRYALASEGLVNVRAKNALPTYRMRYSYAAGKYVNGLDPGVGEIFDQRFAVDADRGTVLSTDLGGGTWAGFLSDLTHDLSEYTLALRVKLKGTLNNINSFISHGDNGANQAKLWTVDVIAHGNFASAPATSFAGDIPAVIDDEWIHLAVTFDGTNFQRYLNGVADGSPFAPTVVSPAFDYNLLGQCQIGKWTEGVNQQWQGLIDDVFVCSSALPDTEIAYLFRT